MVLWVILAVLTAVSAMAVIVPLARSRAEAAPASAHDLAVYRDQLAEVDRDRERGLIGEAEAEAARTEIARRLLKAGSAGTETAAARSWGRPAAIAVTVALPLAALATYVNFGSPDLPAQPLQARLETPGDPNNIMDMIARVEAHLLNNPGDANGWRVIAPIYMRLGRLSDAADAYQRLIQLTGPTPQLQENLAEALIASNSGMVTAEAQAAADAAVEAEPDRVKARFFRALGNAQGGKAELALADYDEIIRRSPPDAPWLQPVRDERAKALQVLGRPVDSPAAAPGAPVAGAQPGPDAAAIAAAAEMSEEDRREMIGGMVQRLADRLEDDPADPAGWQQLIRAYVVLDRKDDAMAAYSKARETFKDDEATLAALEGAARAAGLVN